MGGRVLLKDRAGHLRVCSKEIYTTRLWYRRGGAGGGGRHGMRLACALTAREVGLSDLSEAGVQFVLGDLRADPKRDPEGVLPPATRRDRRCRGGRRRKERQDERCQHHVRHSHPFFIYCLWSAPFRKFLIAGNGTCHFRKRRSLPEMGEQPCRYPVRPFRKRSIAGNNSHIARNRRYQ